MDVAKGKNLDELLKKYSDMDYSDMDKRHLTKYSLKKAEFIKRYADIRNFDISNSEMNIILHKKINGIKILVSEHPNNDYFTHIEDGEKVGFGNIIWLSEDIINNNDKSIKNSNGIDYKFS